MYNLEKIIERTDLENKVNALQTYETKSRKNEIANESIVNCSKCDVVGTTNHG